MENEPLDAPITEPPEDLRFAFYNTLLCLLKWIEAIFVAADEHGVKLDLGQRWQNLREAEAHFTTLAAKKLWNLWIRS